MFKSKKSKCVVLKMANSDEVICELVKSTKSKYTIRSPRLVQVSTYRKRYIMSLIDGVEVDIELAMVVTSFDATEDQLQAYEAALESTPAATPVAVTNRMLTE